MQKINWFEQTEVENPQFLLKPWNLFTIWQGKINCWCIFLLSRTLIDISPIPSFDKRYMIYHQFNVLQLSLCFAGVPICTAHHQSQGSLNILGFPWSINYIISCYYQCTVPLAESLAKYPLTITYTLFYTPMYIHYCSCRTVYVVVWWEAWKSHMIVVCACSGVPH